MSDQPQSINTELLPAPGKEGLGYKVFTLLDAILKRKAQLDLPNRWNRNYELARNKHWKQPNSKKVSLISANLLFAHRQRTVNMLTDNNPTFNIARIGEVTPELEDVYTKLLRTTEHWWTDQEQQHTLEKSVSNGETYGATVEKVRFNPELEFGIGEVETELVDPFNFGFYPTGTMDIQKAQAVLHFWPMSIREARRKFPEHAKNIKSDNELLKELSDARKEIEEGGTSGAPKGYSSTLGGVIKWFQNNSDENSDANDDENVLIVEAWAKDYSTDEEGNPLYFGNIRCVTVCNGGKLVLSDRNNPSINPNLDIEQAMKTYLFDKYPFSFSQSITDNTNPWGMSDFEQLEALQIEINKSLSQMTTLKDKVARTKLINPKDSGVKNAEFTNMAGIVNPASAMAANGIRYLDSPDIPADLINVINIAKEYFFLVSGSFELEQAQTPGQEVIAYKAIAALIERASTMLKGKIRNYGKMIRERGRMYLSHVMNWYTEDRWISYEEDGSQMSEQIRGSEMIVPAKMTVVSGSTMPRSQIQEREEALDLFSKGAIDGEELLKRLDWPDRKVVVNRMNAGMFNAKLFSKLTELGAPEPLISFFNELVEMDDKEFDRALEQGEVPPLDQVLAAMFEQPEQGAEAPPNPLEQAELIVKQAEAEYKQAQTQKVIAEAQLVAEKIQTEKVQQQVARAGVQLDEEKIKIERARTVADIKAKTVPDPDPGVSEFKGSNADKSQQGPYREKGMKSNNQTEAQ